MTLEKWDPTKHRDTYRDDILKLIEQKAHGKLKAMPKVKAPRQAEVIDFSALLERSLAARKKPAASAKSTSSRRKGASASHRRAA
jgi:DNA end-binding protein Ku